MTERKINRREIVKHANGTYDFRIVAAENGDILAFSNQGYNNIADCITTATRATMGKVDPVLAFVDSEA